MFSPIKLSYLFSTREGREDGRDRWWTSIVCISLLCVCLSQTRTKRRPTKVESSLVPFLLESWNGGFEGLNNVVLHCRFMIKESCALKLVGGAGSYEQK